jgi:hypothetical protein
VKAWLALPTTHVLPAEDDDATRSAGDLPAGPPRPPAPEAGQRPDRYGEIATVYADERGVHYIILLGGRLVPVEDEGQFIVLPEEGG